MKNTFTPEELIQFADEHIQSKAQHNELEFAGIHNDADLQLYKQLFLKVS